jgi:hypothetical protein
MKRQDVATRQRIAQSHGARAPAKVSETTHAIPGTRCCAAIFRTAPSGALSVFERKRKLQICCKSLEIEPSHARVILLGWRLLRLSRKAMQPQVLTGPHVLLVTRTLRFKVKTEAHAWLNAAAYEVNQVWNWAAQMSEKAARPCTGEPKWLTGLTLMISPRVPLSISTKSVRTQFSV